MHTEPPFSVRSGAGGLRRRRGWPRMSGEPGTSSVARSRRRFAAWPRRPPCTPLPDTAPDRAATGPVLPARSMSPNRPAFALFCPSKFERERPAGICATVCSVRCATSSWRESAPAVFRMRCFTRTRSNRPSARPTAHLLRSRAVAATPSCWLPSDAAPGSRCSTGFDGLLSAASAQPSHDPGFADGLPTNDRARFLRCGFTVGHNGRPAGRSTKLLAGVARRGRASAARRANRPSSTTLRDPSRVEPEPRPTSDFASGRANQTPAGPTDRRHQPHRRPTVEGRHGPAARTTGRSGVSGLYALLTPMHVLGGQ